MQPNLALYTPNKWQVGRGPIRVCFMDGDKRVHDIIKQIENSDEGWGSASALGFEFIDDCRKAEIRVTLTRGTSWSYLGDYRIPYPAPTMQLGWASVENPVEVRRVWLHEAGHALSFFHEHETQLALATIPWDWPGIYKWCADHNVAPSEWRAQWLAMVSPEVIEQPTYDPDSILHYYIPKEWVLDRRVRGGATRLSAEDRRAVVSWYGPSRRPPKEKPDNIDVFLPIVKKNVR